MPLERSIFETQHPIIAFALKTTQATFYATLLRIGNNLSQDLSKYLAKIGTEKIESFVYKLTLQEEQPAQCADHSKDAPLTMNGVDSAVHIGTDS